ncbi:MAG: leucine-rich repeat protein, partial [Clostridia bacterium]|nr:leucine-rich repeat protein [Clostridia bacterium]
FHNCERLHTVTLPASLTAIDQDVFTNCPELARINFAGTESQWQQITINANQKPILDKAEIVCNYTQD